MRPEEGHPLKNVNLWGGGKEKKKKKKKNDCTMIAAIKKMVI